MRAMIPVIALVGVALLVMSAAWPWLFRPEGAWSDQQARQHHEISHRVFVLAGHGGHDHGAEKPAGPADGKELEEAKAKLAESDAQLRNAQSRGQTTVLILRWAALACLAGALAMSWHERAKS